MDTVRFEIGYLDLPERDPGIGSWNFCVRRLGKTDHQTLYLYVGNLGDDKDGEMLGGGLMTYCEGDVKFEHVGSFQGSVPNSVMDYFAPMVYWAAQDKKFPIRNIEVDLAPPDLILFRTESKRWEKLGFDFAAGKIEYKVKNNLLFRKPWFAAKESLEERVR